MCRLTITSRCSRDLYDIGDQALTILKRAAYSFEHYRNTTKNTLRLSPQTIIKPNGP